MDVKYILKNMEEESLKEIDVKDIEFIQCKKCGKYLNTEKIVDNLRILAEYMLQMEINERLEERKELTKCK